MIFGINTSRDISKLFQISLAQRLVKLRITISRKYNNDFYFQFSKTTSHSKEKRQGNDEPENDLFYKI